MYIHSQNNEKFTILHTISEYFNASLATISTIKYEIRVETLESILNKCKVLDISCDNILLQKVNFNIFTFLEL